MNKLYFISLLLFATTIQVFAQDRGISYQAVAIDAMMFMVVLLMMLR
jgi:hypothetical protein